MLAMHSRDIFIGACAIMSAGLTFIPTIFESGAIG